MCEPRCNQYRARLLPGLSVRLLLLGGLRLWLPDSNIVTCVRLIVNSEFIIFYVNFIIFYYQTLRLPVKSIIKGGQMYGHAIAQARERAGLSQREVCKAIGISQGYLGGIETGRNNPGVLHLIVELAKVYRCGINQLLGVPDAGELAIQETKDLFDRLSLGSPN